MTWWRGSRSATTPPSSRKKMPGTRTAAATYPTSLAEPPIASTAKGVATMATAVPVTEMTLHASSSRKLRLCSGPGTGACRPACIPGRKSRIRIHLRRNRAARALALGFGGAGVAPGVMVTAGGQRRGWGRAGGWAASRGVGLLVAKVVLLATSLYDDPAAELH